MGNNCRDWKTIFCVIVFSFSSLAAAEQTAGGRDRFLSTGDSGHLTPQQIERVQACKRLLREVDFKSLPMTIAELEHTPYPEENLQVMEAVAMTYADIVKEHSVDDDENKKWLHGMIMLNMAYLQLGGDQYAVGGNAPLNRLIGRKLREHLPPDLLNHPGLFHPLE